MGQGQFLSLLLERHDDHRRDDGGGGFAFVDSALHGGANSSCAK